MKRLVLLPLLAAVLLTGSACAFVAAATASAGSAPIRAVVAAKPRATVTLCDRAHQTAVFDGRMESIPKAERLQMRFRLQVSTPGQPGWSRVPVPGFSSWVTSDPGRQRYVYTKRVEALLGPASYRVQVWFRWLDAAGATLRTAHVISKSCHQPDPRPDLRVTGIGLAEPGRYDVRIRNAGRSDAGASTVQLQFPDGSLATAGVPPMTPGDREDVFVSGPSCSVGQTITATADVGDAVDERDEANTVTLPCPSA
jgi:hypothetical protein